MNKDCVLCKTNFTVKDSYDLKNRKFCSHKCYSLSMLGKMPKSPPPHKPKRFIECMICKNKIWARHKDSKCCSRTCSGKYYSLRYGNNHDSYMCIVCNKTIQIPGLYFKRKTCSRECLILSKRGKNSPTWKGGIKKEKDRRKSFEMVMWRKAVFSRDDYTCRLCEKRGGRLQPHHILPYSKFKDQRGILDNGITLCLDCHGHVHKYAGINYIETIDKDTLREIITSSSYHKFFFDSLQIRKPSLLKLRTGSLGLALG